MEGKVIEGMGNIPKIGQTVYVVYDGEIFVEKVYALGKDAFIVAEWKNSAIKTDFFEWHYDDVGSTWFTDFGSAKEYILSFYCDDYELVEYDTSWYRVERI